MSADHARRGRAWQGLLEHWHDEYRRDRRAVVWPTSPPVRVLSRVGANGQFRACWAGDGPPDYVGFVAGGQGVLFDAKDCSLDAWPLRDLERHQARDLEAAHVAGHRAFVALRLGGEGWVLPWSSLGPRWWAWWEADRVRPGEASLTAADCDQLGHRMREPGDWL